MWSKGCVSPARGNTAKADYCLILILLSNECSDKYQGKVKMCVKASVRWYPQSSGLFLPIYAPLDSYYFTATDNCHWLTGQTTYHLPNISIWTNGAKCFFFLLNSGKLDCMFLFVFLFCTLHLCSKCIQFCWARSDHIKVSFRVVLYHNLYSKCWPGLSRLKAQQFVFHLSNTWNHSVSLFLVLLDNLNIWHR